jgi:5-methylcytosine-specific restriction protein A
MRAASTMVDHIVNKASGGDDSIENLQGICAACHAAKTAQESKAARVNTRTGFRRAFR